MSRHSMDFPPIVAIDFDGTVTDENDYHNFTMDSPIKRGCVDVLQRLKSKGTIIILWTCRAGEDLEKAVKYCELHNVPIDFVNENVPWLIEAWGHDSRKIYADYYIDDLAFDKSDFRIDWYEIESYINTDMFFRCKNCAYSDDTHCNRIISSSDTFKELYGIEIDRAPKIEPIYGCKHFTYTLKEAIAEQ